MKKLSYRVDSSGAITALQNNVQDARKREREKSQLWLSKYGKFLTEFKSETLVAEAAHEKRTKTRCA